jgi:uncharacterized membrane protein
MTAVASTPQQERRKSIGAGALFGIGIAGFVDETVFHQILHWHHFWDGGSAAAGLVSDGLFHAGSWICLVAGLFWFADLRRRGGAVLPAWVSGILFGAGGFQLYDGTIQHKILGLHQIRYHVTIWPYDLVWNILALIMLIAGWILLRRTPAGAADGRAAAPVRPPGTAGGR